MQTDVCSFEQNSSKTLAPATSQYTGCSPLCIHTHTQLCYLSHVLPSPLQTGVSQSAGKAKSSLLILSAASQHFSSSMKNRLLLHLQHDPVLQVDADLIGATVQSLLLYYKHYLFLT